MPSSVSGWKSLDFTEIHLEKLGGHRPPLQAGGDREWFCCVDGKTAAGPTGDILPHCEEASVHRGVDRASGAAGNLGSQPAHLRLRDRPAGSHQQGCLCLLAQLLPLESPWHHDYPDADDLLTKMLGDRTNIEIASVPYEIVRLDDPEVFRYPFLYLSEPGFLDLTDREVANLGEYIRRGGFIMVDDFRTGKMLGHEDEIDVLRRYLKRAAPDRELVRLNSSHPIFHCFFDIDTLEMDPPYEIPEPPQFWGMSDDNGNLQVIASYNNDIGDYWRYLDDGDKPLKYSAKAVRLGVNYVVYALTH
ncbi:MAG TPA: DUF4159 domain-containing protein [Terriglobia bacterium]|nr:DUF4159 domain-containing protein [Terriglobia bacterium]